MAEKICSVCNNLSDNCMACGGTNVTKERRNGIRVCPSCHNQSDNCMTCGGNTRRMKSDEDREEDDAWEW